MRYVAVLVIIMAFVRIDILLEFFDKVSTKISNQAPPQELSPGDVKSSLEMVPLKEDQTIRQTPKAVFLSLLEDFHVNPTADLRSRAMEYFKSHPTIFGLKLDRDLEDVVYKWREHINNNEPELVSFLLDLQSVLKGENLELLRRFFSLWMEINLDHFVAAYVRTKDQACTIATVFGDPIPEEEKLNEYYDREDAFKEFVKKEKVDPTQRVFAENCLIQLGLVIEQLRPKNAPGFNEGAVLENQTPVAPDASQGTTNP